MKRVKAVCYLLNMKNIRPAKSDYALNIHICGKTLLLDITRDPVFSQAQYAQIPMAVVGIVMKFFQIVISIVVGMAAGCIPIVGFNIGAGQNKRVKELFTKLLTAEAAVGAAAMALVEFSPDCLSLFLARQMKVSCSNFNLQDISGIKQEVAAKLGIPCYDQELYT